MLVFELMGRERNPMEANYWLVGAVVGGKRIKREGSVKDFLLQLEAMDAKPNVTDLVWLNKLCQAVFGRNYRSATEGIQREKEKARAELERAGIIQNTDRTKSKR